MKLQLTRSESGYFYDGNGDLFATDDEMRALGFGLKDPPSEVSCWSFFAIADGGWLFADGEQVLAYRNGELLTDKTGVAFNVSRRILNVLPRYSCLTLVLIPRDTNPYRTFTMSVVYDGEDLRREDHVLAMCGKGAYIAGLIPAAVPSGQEFELRVSARPKLNFKYFELKWQGGWLNVVVPGTDGRTLVPPSELVTMAVNHSLPDVVWVDLAPVAEPVAPQKTVVHKVAKRNNSCHLLRDEQSVGCVACLDGMDVCGVSVDRWPRFTEFEATLADGPIPGGQRLETSWRLRKPLAIVTGGASVDNFHECLYHIWPTMAGRPVWYKLTPLEPRVYHTLKLRLVDGTYISEDPEEFCRWPAGRSAFGPHPPLLEVEFSNIPGIDGKIYGCYGDRVHIEDSAYLVSSTVLSPMNFMDEGYVRVRKPLED